MSNYTKGPWYVHSLGKHWNNDRLERLEICYGKDDECICDTVYEMDDARLIAASPDIYEALKELVIAVSLLPANDGRIMGLMPLIAKAENALDKAEGKSN